MSLKIIETGAIQKLGCGFLFALYDRAAVGMGIPMGMGVG